MTNEEIVIANFEKKNLTISAHGLCTVNWELPDLEFELLFEDNKVCHVPSGLIEFLAPKIARLRKSDASVTSYTFIDCSFDVFSDLVTKLQRGIPVDVDRTNFEDLLKIACDLENDELISSIFSAVDIDNLTIDKALSLWKVENSKRFGYTGSFGDLRTFLASHFYDIPESTMADLDLPTLESLLSDPSLKIKDEDSLYDLIRSKIDRDLSFSRLFEFVYFEYLSPDRIAHFVSFMATHLLDTINATIWNRISQRLIMTPSFSKDDDNDPRIMDTPAKEFPYEESKPLNGIISHLTQEFGGNVHDKGIVEITASSVNGGDCEPKCVADLEADSIYCSADELDTWICYDFKDMRVTPTSYSIRSHCHGYSGYFNLKSWVLEVSNNGTSWDIIDQRNDNFDLDDENVTCNFKIDQVPEDSKYRFIRLRQTGPNHRRTLTLYYVSISSFEIFGKLFEK